jgi:hypothetical protein
VVSSTMYAETPSVGAVESALKRTIPGKASILDVGTLPTPRCNHTRPFLSVPLVERNQSSLCRR